MTTKKIIKAIVFPIYISLIFVSCSDFLTEIDPNRITVESFWKTESDYNKALISTYSPLRALQNRATGSGHMQAETSIPLWTSSGGVELMNFTYSNNNGYPNDKWNDLYEGIFRANQVLENLKDADFGEGFKTRIEAEARFLRGLYYFWLASNFNKGNVILKTSFPKNDDDYYAPVSPKADVYALIIDDLTFAQSHLPREWNSQNLGRATWGAATGILGQLYLYEKRYDDAKRELKAIIDSDIYKLTPDISWNFDEEHEHNSESIFEINYSVELKDGSNLSSTRADNIAPQEAGGNRGVEPSYHMVMLFKSDPPDPANPVNQGQRFSQRCLASICFKGDGGIFYQRHTYEFPFMVDQEAHIKKLQNWKLPQEPETNRSGINERVLRLADVYLMYAETVLKTTGDLNEAISYINRVRERSAVLQLNVNEYNTVDKLMTHLMRVERPLELAWEGHAINWQDIKRWGIVKSLYEELSQIKYYRHDVLYSNVELTIATQNNINNPEEGYIIRSEFVEAARNYNSEEHDYFRIPQNEVNYNPWVE